METFFKEFEKIIKQLKIKKNQINLDDEYIVQLSSIYGGFTNCGRRITQAAKFIDFYVHDILDYTLLNKNENGFVK